jgi:hypothetical protein
VAKSQEDISTPAQDPDLLAAVVLHVLVTDGRDGISTARMAHECERDPADEAERREVEVALEILVRDDLAIREAEDPEAPLGEGDRFRPTRAAVRAAELSF